MIAYGIPRSLDNYQLVLRLPMGRGKYFVWKGRFFMEQLLILLATIIPALLLYLLNKVFNYKDKLINHFGTIKYKGSLCGIALFLSYISVFKYNIRIHESPIALSAFWCYLYLVTVYKQTQGRNKHGDVR